MLVFWNQGLVFLSVPKTGTTAWEEALAPHASIAVLDPPDLKHAPLYRYNRFFRPMFEKVGAGSRMETIAVVREPVSWLGSWYRFRRRPFMAGLLAFLEGRLDMRIELPRRNVSPEMDLVLSPDVERWLRRKCSDEFALWEAITPGEA